MKKLLILSTGAVGIAAAGIMVVPNFVHAQNGSANGAGYGYDQSLTSKAQILGLTKDQLQTQLKTKSLYQIAKDKGVSEVQLHEKMQTAAVERWKSRGLTQTEIDSRLKSMEERQANCDGTGTGGGMHGYGRNR
jgi:hypothetical protein